MQFFFFIILFQEFASQWLPYQYYLTTNTIFQEATSQDAYKYTENFYKPLTTFTTANFINCSNPPTSYITLDKSNLGVEYNNSFSFSQKFAISYDLYFHGTWNSGYVRIDIGICHETISYLSQNPYSLTSGFCDSTPYQVQTFNYSFATSCSGQMSFLSSNNMGGMVSIRNVVITKLKCYPSCKTCDGPAVNQCQSCYDGTISVNICPGCPINKYYVKFLGCRDICNFDSLLFQNGFCQEYPVNYFQMTKFENNPFNVENLKWSINYDKNHIDNSIALGLHANILSYGIFKYKSGIQRFVNEIAPDQGSKLIGFQIVIVIFGQFPMQGGINFQLNNTYYGSIFKISSEIQTHNMKIYDVISLGQWLSYSNCQKYELHMFIDIPQYPFLFSSSSNFTDDSAGWGLVSLKVSSGYCPSNCKECEVSFQCKTCIGSFQKYRDGTCIHNCDKTYQKSVNNYCTDFDDETPYSKFLVQEYIDYANDLTQSDQYTLVSQNNVNFLKGASILYSYWKNYRVFGGPYVWAQAKFQRRHIIQDPHHSITIGFDILFGPEFPLTGSFIYIIQSNPSVTININYVSNPNDDQTKTYRVYEKINHNSNWLDMVWECFGNENEPVKSYCAFYNYYIAVHYCQPFCLQCTNQDTCTQWNSTYNSNVIKFSQSGCSGNQYHSRNELKCLNCPSSCTSCTSPIDCQGCSLTYTLTKLGCVCKQNQYEDSNQCHDCPPLCTQCLNTNYCIECFLTDFREQVNGQCVCMQGYYPQISNSICFQCHKFCKTCTGPSYTDCSSCSDISGIQQNANTCKCPDKTFYEELSNSCIDCHSTCLTCFTKSMNGCFTCDETQHRVLKGLKCECSPGYYENNNVCQNCPLNIDTSLTQCYVLCANNLSIWHSPGCTSCDTGFQLVNADCQPICGDLQIKGNEECEDSNRVLNDKCYNCRFQCPAHCLTCNIDTTLPCSDVCGDGLITGLEECEDGNNIQFDGCYNCKFQCQTSCTRCLMGICQECAGGWQIDPITWKCKERCGDLMLVGKEQCEDANQSDTDGCKECRYFCRIGCSSCNYEIGICLTCQFPGFVPNQYYCQNNCGDGLVVVDPYGFFEEVCDDVGCNSDCKTCKQGYLLKNSICEPICNDSLLVQKEMCEDSFILPYRGCQNCKTKCQLSCLVCDTTGKGCLQCDVGYEIFDYLCYSICGDHIVTIDEECDDGNLIIGDGCHFCQYSCQDSCLNCIKGKCLNCLDNYQLLLSTCQLKCENQIAIPQEQCDYILFSNDGCYQCFQCSENCEVCQNGICKICQTNFELDNIYNHCTPIQSTKFDIQLNCIQMKDNQCLTQNQEFIDFITNPDFEIDRCPQNCKICQFNNCMECKQGYYGKQCISKCGDNIIVSEEECDEGKGRLLNECSNCKFVCPDFCKLCVFGICQECQSGFYLDIVSNTCYSICGDNILASNEVCDDGNDIEFDGCFQCQYQCEIECVDCQFGKCAQCLEPFFLVQSKIKCESLQSCEAQDGFYYESFSNSCVNLCGDGIVAGNEECDDSNTIPYDGCNECKFQCSQLCTLCDKGICLNELCPLGAILINNSCCGDAILNGDEECDDGNNIDFDGCSNCQYQCNEFCSVCLKGKCVECIQGFELDYNNKCVENENENENENNLTESQQSNHLNQNQNEVCRNDECAFSLRPKMRLFFLNQTFSHQYVEINFDQQVQFADLPDEEQFLTFEIQIQDLNEQYYNIQLDTIVGITQDLQVVQYIIDIEIFQELQEKPNLQVFLIQNVVNSNNQTIIQPQQSILLYTPRIMNAELKSKVIAMSQTNKAFMISAISISVVSLIFGEASLFIETLSALQYQSYLKFINLDYPENLYIYFQTSEMLSLSNYLQSLQIEYVLGIITRKEENQIRTDGKFALYDVDCDLILNLIPQMFQLIILLTIIFKSKKIYIMYQNFFSKMFSNYQLQNPKNVNQKIIQFVLNVGQQIKKIIKYRHQFSLRLIMPIFSLNAWDILFKLLLQIHFNKRQSPRQQFQYICSLSILTLYLTIILQSYSKSIIRNQCTDKNSLQIKYATLDICRTFLFNIVLIFFQNQQIIQSLLIAINSILHCFFIQKYQQVNKLDKFVNIFTEATVALFSLTTFVYYKENLFTYQTILQVGFFHMGILMLSLALVFCKQIFKKISMISSKIIEQRKNKNINRHEIFC